MHKQLIEFNYKVLRRDWLVKQIPFTLVQDVNHYIRCLCYQVNHIRKLMDQSEQILINKSQRIKLSDPYWYVYTTINGLLIYANMTHNISNFNKSYFKIKDNEIIYHKIVKFNQQLYENTRTVETNNMPFTFTGTKIGEDLYQDVTITFY